MPTCIGVKSGPMSELMSALHTAYLGEKRGLDLGCYSNFAFMGGALSQGGDLNHVTEVCECSVKGCGPSALIFSFPERGIEPWSAACRAVGLPQNLFVFTMH